MLCKSYRLQGRWPECEKLARKRIDFVGADENKRNFQEGRGQYHLIHAYVNLHEALLNQGRTEEAAQVFEQLGEFRRQLPDEKWLEYYMIHQNRAETHHSSDDRPTWLIEASEYYPQDRGSNNGSYRF